MKNSTGFRRDFEATDGDLVIRIKQLSGGEKMLVTHEDGSTRLMDPLRV